METKDPKSVKPTAELVRIYNRSTRQTFDHPPYKASPSSFANVPKDLAERWLRLFPETIVEAGVAQKELGGLSAELAGVRVELESSKVRNVELETLLKKTKDQLAAAQQV